MKTLTWLVALCSTLIFVPVACLSVTIGESRVPGLLNPDFVVDVLPGKKVAFAASLLLLFVTLYIHWLVRWIQHAYGDKRSDGLPTAVETTDDVTPTQRLKAAIRSGDVASVLNQLADPLMSYDADPDLLTPLELAELYGDREIIALLVARFRPPISQGIAE